MSDNAPIDELMEAASVALVERRYLDCERLCRDAVTIARRAGDYERLGRIMLPLQECRRQRRQIAAEHGVTVLGGATRRPPEQIIDDHPRGCLLLTDPPYQAADATALRTLARERGLMVEVLLLDQPGLVAAFERAAEDRGDAAIARLAGEPGPERVVETLLDELDAIGDHEKAHQRVAEAARQAAKQQR